MSTEEVPKSAKISREEFDIIQNRIQLALAKRENIIKSWTAKSSRKEPTKTQAELDAEDAALFRNEPPYLGVGAPIPAQFLVSDAERNNKSLRAKLFPGKGLKGSKPRDSEEKAASAKRALNDESSDEEGGRSNLGKAKKLKTTTATPAATPATTTTEGATAIANDDKNLIGTGNKKGEKLGDSKVEDSLATPPDTPESMQLQAHTRLEVKLNNKLNKQEVRDGLPIRQKSHKSKKSKNKKSKKDRHQSQ